MTSNLPDEQWLEHLENGECYTAEVFIAGMVGLFSAIQIFNPVASGVRVRIRCVEAFTIFGIPVNQNLRRHDTALASSGAFGIIENLLGGGPAGVGQMRFDNLAAQPGTPYWLILAGGNNRRQYPVAALDWGFDLLPGQGLASAPSITNFFMLVGFQWVEVPL